MFQIKVYYAKTSRLGQSLPLRYQKNKDSSLSFAIILAMFTIFLGIFLVALGIAMLKYWQAVYNFTGGIDIIEKWSPAGTPAFIRIFAALLVLFGLGMIFGLWTWLTQPFAEGVKGLSGQGIQPK